MVNKWYAATYNNWHFINFKQWDQICRIPPPPRLVKFWKAFGQFSIGYFGIRQNMAIFKLALGKLSLLSMAKCTNDQTIWSHWLKINQDQLSEIREIENQKLGNEINSALTHKGLLTLYLLT